MEQLKNISKQTINKVRNSPGNSGLAYKEYGKHMDINQYSDDEISEMVYGIYTFGKVILVDGDYFVSLEDVVETVCVLEDASYKKTPTANDIKTNAHNTINNIRTFYIKDYFLITSKPVGGQTRHRITNYLYKIGAIRAGRNQYKDCLA